MGQKKVRVYGGGSIAARRVHTLLGFGADVTVTAPVITKEIASLPGLALEYRAYEPGEIAGRKIPPADYILAATDSREVNEKIYLECRQAGIWVNNASDRRQCDFLFPAIIRAGDMVIGVSSGGTDHTGTAKLAGAIREWAAQGGNGHGAPAGTGRKEGKQHEDSDCREQGK